MTIEQTIDKDKINRLSKLIAGCRNVVITTHIAPDGDAVGSSLALYHLLSDLGKTVKVITPDMFAQNLFYLPGSKDIVIYSRYEEFAKQLIEEADLIFCLDYNSIKRIDRVGPHVLASKAPKVMIDHHLYPEDFPTVLISRPNESSTCALLFRVISALGLLPLLNKTIASCIYTGMMTDTGNFSYNSNDPELYAIIIKLLEAGINKDRLYTNIINTSNLSRLKINAYAVDRKLQLFPEHQAALITLTMDELNSRGYQKGDTESLVNVPLQLRDITYSFYLRQEPDYIKVSSRSKGDFPVNKICSEHFNGGGHLNAAGGEFLGSMEECVAKLIEVMPQYDPLLPDKTKPLKKL